MPGEVDPANNKPAAQAPSQIAPQPARQATQAPQQQQWAQPPWMEKFLENQTRDLELRAEQIELSKQQEQHWFEYSQSSLEAQLKDRTDWRVTWLKTIRLWSWLGLTIIILLLAFLALLALTGHENFALELAKVVIYGGLGGFGGYGVARSRQKTSTTELTSGQ